MLRDGDRPRGSKHDAIALGIINDPRRLRGQEARFLRVLLHLSQEAMARTLGVDRHGDAYRQIFEAGKHGWRERKAA